jgi:hypothetical protein
MSSMVDAVVMPVLGMATSGADLSTLAVQTGTGPDRDARRSAAAAAPGSAAGGDPGPAEAAARDLLKQQRGTA